VNSLAKSKNSEVSLYAAFCHIILCASSWSQQRYRWGSVYMCLQVSDFIVINSLTFCFKFTQQVGSSSLKNAANEYIPEQIQYFMLDYHVQELHYHTICLQTLYSRIHAYCTPSM
jgi:hypothetical protein